MTKAELDARLLLIARQGRRRARMVAVSPRRRIYIPQWAWADATVLHELCARGASYEPQTRDDRIEEAFYAFATAIHSEGYIEVRVRSAHQGRTHRG